MQKFGAEAVYEIARISEQLSAQCNLLERWGNVRFKEPVSMEDLQSGKIPETEAIEILSARTIREMTPQWKSTVRSLFEAVQYHGSLTGLTLAVQAASRYKQSLDSGTLTTYTDVQSAVKTLETIVTLQLRENLFMYIPVERAKYYAQPQLFGEQFSNKFPDCQYDVEEAGNCYASGRSTACAFHLMRVIEVTVRRFGSAVGINLAGEKDWHNVLEEVNKAIKTLPQRDQRTIMLAGISGHLYNVKVAWRNPTMHPKTTYTLEEASDLLASVRAFTAELANIIQ